MHLDIDVNKLRAIADEVNDNFEKKRAIENKASLIIQDIPSLLMQRAKEGYYTANVMPLEKHHHNEFSGVNNVFFEEAEIVAEACKNAGLIVFRNSHNGKYYLFVSWKE
jgi:hypothetical protein